MTFDTTGLTEKVHTNGGTLYYEDELAEIVAKMCTKCSIVKGLSEFQKDKVKLGGVRSHCKYCASIIYQNNRERERERKRVYYQNNRKRERVKRINYYYNNLEDEKARRRSYYQNNREDALEYSKIYHLENRERISEYDAEYRRNNRERIAMREVVYHRNNPHVRRLKDSRRRARLSNLPDRLTHEQKAQILEHFSGACALTGDIGDVHLDHVIPISVGHGGTIYENIIPLRADFNISKSNRNIFDWFEDNRDRFGLEQRKFDELIEYLAEINEMTTKEYRDFVYWCHDNSRTVEEIEADNERYGYMKPSSEIWREEVANKGRELVEA